jgi:hypothetical protein
MSEGGTVNEPAAHLEPAIQPRPNPALEGAPPAMPVWLRRWPAFLYWYARSRVGDHGRLLPSRRLTHITRHVYVGGQVGLSGWRLMEKKWGISALLNLRIEWDDRWMNIHAPHYLWLPAIDGTPPVYEQLVRGAQFIQTQVEAGRSIYVHCAAGLGRGPTMVTAYLVAQGLSVGEAIAFIAARRPFISLSVKQRARLLEFEARVRRLGLSLEAVRSESTAPTVGQPLADRRIAPVEAAGDEV